MTSNTPLRLARRHWRRAPLAAVVLAILVFTVPAAEAGWKPPKYLSAAGENAQSPDVSTGGGITVAVWRRFDGSQPPNTCCYRIEARVRRPGHGFGATKLLSGPGQGAGGPVVSVGPDGTAVVLWTRFDGTDPPFSCCQRVQARVYRPGKGWGNVQNLSAAGQDAMDVHIGVGREGRAVAMWTREESEFGPRRLQARFRGANEGGKPSFGGLQNLNSPGDYAYESSLGVARNGAAVAVWEQFDGQDDRAVSRLRRPGKRFGNKLRYLSPAGQTEDYPIATMGPDGTALAAWIIDTSPYPLQARIRPPGGKWGAIKQLSANATADYAAVAVDARGRASVAWEQNLVDTRIKVRTRIPGRGFGKSQYLSAAGQPAQNPVLSIGSDLTAFAGWLRLDGNSDFRAQARLRRPRGGNFVMKETLSEGGADATDLALAAGRRGTASAVWERFDGSDQRIQFARNVP